MLVEADGEDLLLAQTINFAQENESTSCWMLILVKSKR